ncbi:MAG: chaperone modulator CbpM [Bacillota bacterium]
MKKYYLQVYHHTPSFDEEDAWVDVLSLGINNDIVQALAELGMVEMRLGCVPASQAGRIMKLMRIRRSLGVNLPGAVIIMELLERLEGLQEEIERLRGR